MKIQFLRATIIVTLVAGSGASTVLAAYEDGRPQASLRLAARDQGVVLRHGAGPSQCDYLGARDVWAWQTGGTYYLHYDGAGPKGWLACLATSQDLEHWTDSGPVLDFGASNRDDSASASYGTTYFDGYRWHMFYLGTPHTTSAPDYIPMFPYLTMKAEAASPGGPWSKQYEVTPFRLLPKSYYSATASPGYIVHQGGEYFMFFSASTRSPILRTIGLARTRDLNGSWSIAAQPLLPPTEQIENSSLYFEPQNQTWFLFTDHVGIKNGLEYTDAVWVYWSKNLTQWDPAHKAVVLDSRNCQWSKHIIGLPSVVAAGKRLAIFYDGQDADPIAPGVKSHLNRDIGLAWLDLPLNIPSPDPGNK